MTFKREKSGSTVEAIEPSKEVEAELEPHVSGLGKVFLMLGIALFWNGMVSIYLWQNIENFRGGGVGWLLAVLMIPFVLIGIGLIALFVDALLALSNPRFHLTLSSASPRLGQKLRLSWESSGALRRLSKLQFILEGKEVAISSSGKKSMTVNSTFYREIIFETRRPLEHGSGHVEFTLPADLMHTFFGHYNQIEWQIQIEGEIQRWPDVRNNYKLIVRPVDQR